MNKCVPAYTIEVNPATRRWDPLPPQPQAFESVLQMDGDTHTSYRMCLVFDPTLSPHYEVFVIPELYTRNFKDYFDPLDLIWLKSFIVVLVSII
jgi:hypothetical protein